MCKPQQPLRLYSPGAPVAHPWRLSPAAKRGIGLGIARCFARDGYQRLVLGYNSNAAAAEAARQQLLGEHPGIQVECVGGDIALPATMEALFAAVEDKFEGRLDAFVHNAGLYIGVTSQSGSAPTASAGDEAAWEYYHQVYVMAFKRGLARALACSGLRHVLAISGAGCNCTQGPVVQYEAPGQGKAALEYLVRLNALKLAGQGINVNCIIPGFTDTEAWVKAGVTGERKEAVVSTTPAGRWGRPEEVGEAAAFLCSARGCFITGVALPVDGGLHLRR